MHTGKKIAPFDVDNFYGKLYPDLLLASCGVPVHDQDFDEIHLFVEINDQIRGKQTEIKNK